MIAIKSIKIICAILFLVAQVSAGNICKPFKQCAQNNMQYFKNQNNIPYYFDLQKVEYVSGTSYTITFRVWTKAKIPQGSLNELKYLGSGIPSDKVMIYSLNTGAGLNQEFNPSDFTLSLTLDSSSANYGTDLTGLPSSFGFQFDFCKGQNTYSNPKNSVFYNGNDYTCQCDWHYGATSFDYYTSCNGDNYCNSQAAFSNWLWSKKCVDIPSAQISKTYSSLSSANVQSYCTYSGNQDDSWTTNIKNWYTPALCKSYTSSSKLPIPTTPGGTVKYSSTTPSTTTTTTTTSSSSSSSSSSVVPTTTSTVKTTSTSTTSTPKTRTKSHAPCTSKTSLSSTTQTSTKSSATTTATTNTNNNNNSNNSNNSKTCLFSSLYFGYMNRF